MPPPLEPDRNAALADADTETATPQDSAFRLGHALAEARPSDPAAVLLAEARLAGALFGSGAPSGLGRFRVLERLGAGGMGVVYAAYDPDLDRGVALKLVRVPTRGRDAALAEAKALARLSHPNVVPVFDVGIEGEHVYIVMELVRGSTLRVWVQERSRGDVVEAYRQAGAALAAAHAAGLIHRDFKPDNAIMGDDGRVRVVDFGLACERADPDGQSPAEPAPIGGTPRYMPPEQMRGEPVTPAADQYSFCVALAEALADADPDRPLPGWLTPILDKGRAPAAPDRFASMPDLLRALGRDPARVWRLRVAIAAAVVVCGVAFTVGRASSTDRGDTCSGGEAELAAAWPAKARTGALVRIASLSAYGHDLAPRLETLLDEFATRWSAGHRDACQAHRRGVQSDALLDRRMACLARGRAALAAVAEIAGGADAKGLPELALASRALPDPDTCADAAALVADVAPPPPTIAAEVSRTRANIERARIHAAAGRSSQAHQLATAMVTEARKLGYPPVLAEALLVQGFARVSMPGRAEAAPALAEATKIAFETGADTLAVEAWARRAWAEGTTGDPAAALHGIEVVEAIAARTTTGRFARALLHNNIGSIELARTELDRARIAFERARDEVRGLTGPGAAELVVIGSNLAIVTEDPDLRDAVIADTVAAMTRLYGRDHPKTLWLRWTQARVTRSLSLAVDRLLAVCEQYEAQEGYRAFAWKCFTDLGLLRYELGDDAGAVAALERAVHLDVAGDSPEAAPYLRLLRGDPRGAAAEFSGRLAAFPEVPASATWMQFDRGRLALGLGRALRAAGRLAEARRALDASVSDLGAGTAEYWGGHVVARAWTELAMTLAALREPAGTVAPIAARARRWLTQTGARAEDVHTVERLAAR